MNVLTQHYDTARTGANLAETVLSPATVSPGRFGKLFEIPVQGHVYAQPLYVSGVNVPGVGVRNALYVATMRNQVAAFDADSGAGLWSTSLGPFVSLPDPNIGPGGYKDIADAVGVVSTPVIALEHQAIYVVAITHDGSQYHHRLHALDLATGHEKLGGPVTIQGTVSGTGDGSVNGQITFTSDRQNQRPGLLLTGGTVYVAFASYGDRDPYHGWVFGFDAATLQQRPNIYNSTRLGSRGGIWMAGQGPAADAAGNVYLITGNGTFSQTAITSKVTLGETAISHPALAATGGPMVVGWTGTDAQQHLNVIQTSNGTGFGGKATLGDTSIDGPALAFGNGRLFLSWTGTDGAHSLNVSQSTDLVSFGSKVTLGERSNSGPALAFGNGRLFLAWTGTDNHLNVLQSSDGVSFGSKVTLGETSGTSPALGFDGANLVLLWSGTDANHSLNILESGDGINFGGKVTLGDTSDFNPALTRQGPLHLTWTGRDAAHSLNHLSGPTPSSLSGKDTYGDTSIAAPALAVFGGRLLLSWTGTDSGHHLNVAELASADPQLGDAFVKLRSDLTLADWFSPWNTQALNAADNDLGSGGALVLPGSGRIVGGGKEGKLYVLDPNNLGHFCATCGPPAGDTQIIQWWQATGVNKGNQPPPPPPATFHHIHGSPVIWQSAGGGPRIYVWGEADWFRAFHFNGSTFTTAPVDISNVTSPAGSMPGGMLTVSANGSADASGVIWASMPISQNANQAVVPGMVRAFDALNLTRELWNSQMAAADNLGMCAKFTPPTVANGKVYAATFSGKVVVYGPK